MDFPDLSNEIMLDYLDSGDTISVSSGTYYGYNLNFTNYPNLNFIGVDGADNVILDGGGQGRVLAVSESLVQGFTIQNGLATDNGGGGIFGYELVNAPKIGIINAHMGFLPKFRGFNVLEWSLFNNDKIGVSLHMIDDVIDTGDIIEFKEMVCREGENIKSLREKASIIGIELIVNFIKNAQSKPIPFKKQTLEKGRQYFAMHDFLKKITDRRLSNKC